MLAKIDALINWLSSLQRSKKRSIKIALDLTIIPPSLILASLMGHDSIEFFYEIDTYAAIFIACFVTIVVFAYLGLYHSLTAHVSLHAGYSIALGCFLSSIALYLSLVVLDLQIPFFVPIYFALILCFLASSMRLFSRALMHSSFSKGPENIAIYGAGMGGIQLMNGLKKSPTYRVVLFIDDDPELVGENIDGIPVKSLNNVEKELSEFTIKTILVALLKPDSQPLHKLLNLSFKHPTAIKRIPSISQLISGEAQITQVVDIEIQDLLGRECVDPLPELMGHEIRNKTVLVTGAGGSIGSELCRQILQFKPRQLICLDVSETALYSLMNEFDTPAQKFKADIIPLVGSVTNQNFILNVLTQHNVSTIYHAAAYKHVPLMEKNPSQVVNNNAIGTFIMAQEAVRANVQSFTLISTDKAVYPTNLMGASKRLAERFCQAMSDDQDNTQFSIVRFGNVLGSSGSVVPLFRKQIQEGGPITVTHPDITRFFMTVTEAVQLVIQASSLAKGGEVFVLDMGESLKVIDLARKMARLANLTPHSSDETFTGPNGIEIKITGLRPGEKMYEELSYEENLIPTQHPRINKVDEAVSSRAEIHNLVEDLNKAITDNNHEGLITILKNTADYSPTP